MTSALPQDHAADSAAKIAVRRSGTLVTLELNRPEALNAFDDDMCRVMADAIPSIARNPDVYIVALTSTSAKAFCAGGDVKALTEKARSDIELVKGYFRNEYTLDWLLECFSKPSVSFINGICMGSGAGLTCFNTHRVAGENYKWAMPETAIGLFPDVGVAHVLARLPWPVGLYLGLTGRPISRADAVWLGIATHAIDSIHYAEIWRRLSGADCVDPMLDGLNRPQDRGPVQSELAFIEATFGADTLNGTFEALRSATGEAKAWADKTLTDLLRKSPISLAITDRHIRSARKLDLRETLIQDYRLAVRCLEGHDFYEGVRAALIDKDHKPAWQIARVEDVPASLIEAYFAPLGDGDLTLPSREEMQAARV